MKFDEIQRISFWNTATLEKFGIADSVLWRYTQDIYQGLNESQVALSSVKLFVS